MRSEKKIQVIYHGFQGGKAIIVNTISGLLSLDYSHYFVVEMISFLCLYIKAEESLMSNSNHEEFVREQEEHNLYPTRMYWFSFF